MQIGDSKQDPGRGGMQTRSVEGTSEAELRIHRGVHEVE